MNKEQDKVVTHIKHDCHNYLHNVFVNSEHYKLERCGICDTIDYILYIIYYIKT